MASTFSDLGEHIGTVVAFAGFLLLMCISLVGVIYKIALTLKADILKMIDKLDDKLESVWGEISKIKDKQDLLREQLPKEYIRLEGPGYKFLVDGIKRIEGHLEAFIEECRRAWRCNGQPGK